MFSGIIKRENMKTKKLIIQYVILGVATMSILITWSIIKNDYAECAEYIIVAFAAIIMLVLLWMGKEQDYSVKILSFNQLKEVIPLSGKDNKEERYFAKLTLEGFYRYNTIVKIYVKKGDMYFYRGLINAEDFDMFYRLKN